MNPNNKSTNRDELLADIAELYYQRGKTQAEISAIIGITRSAISRMLTEARQKGIVEIHVHRPLRYDDRLESSLQSAFGLKGIRVVEIDPETAYPELQIRLGAAAAQELSRLLKPKMIIGVAWGTTVKNVVDALPPIPMPDSHVVQLLGVLGSTRHNYSGQSLVESLAHKLGGEGTYLYTPFRVETSETADLLKNDPAISKTLSLGAHSDLALLGIGSVKPKFCSLYQGGHISRISLRSITQQNAVGNVSGRYFDINGNLSDVEIHKQLIGITADALLKVPLKFGAAGNTEKAEAILGALRGSFINYLVTDNHTASRILKLAASGQENL